MKTLAFVLCAAATPAVASADALPKPIDAMQVMLGSWKGTGTLTAGKDKTKLDVAWTCKPASGKLGVLCTLAAKGVPGLGPMEETDLFGYDGNTDTYHWFAITNVGETHDHVAKNPGDFSKLQFTFNGTLEGKPFKEVIDLEMSKDSKQATGRAETFVGGTSASVLEIKLRKS